MELKQSAQLRSSDQIICINKYVNSSTKLWNKKNSQLVQQILSWQPKSPNAEETRLFAVVGMTQMDISDDMVMSNQNKTKQKEKRKALDIIFPLFSGCVAALSQFLTQHLWKASFTCRKMAHVQIKYSDPYPSCEQAGYSDEKSHTY